MSAKGSLKLARDPKFQALFAIRGVSANVYKLDINGILANKEFNDLIRVLGCNIGNRFDINKLQFNKIIIASDSDVDGYFIRSLLCSFFFKIFPEIIEDGRLFIAEPPLYKVDNKKNPFVINKEDYVQKYVQSVIKEYNIGTYSDKEIKFFDIKDKEELKELQELLTETSSYVEDLSLISNHYQINDRLLEIILEELVNDD
jgi:DNA gyrase/topoisomerase IV subunit B